MYHSKMCLYKQHTLFDIGNINREYKQWFGYICKMKCYLSPVLQLK